MTTRLLRTTSIEHKALWRLKNGKKAFVKIFASSFQSKINSIYAGLERERTCLEVLQGLAVPDLIKLKPSELPQITGPKKLFVMAQSFAGDKNVHSLKFKLHELVGVWIFFVEQLAAFRRHKIIYTDFKCGNIMGQRKPLNVTVIDFDYAFPLIRGRKTLMCHGYTPGYESPESMRNEIGTEQSLVYESALMLFHFLTNSDNKNLNDPQNGLSKAAKLLQAMDSPDLAKLLELCLKNDPNQRPKNYEDVLRRIKRGKLPKKIDDFWKKLRNPYAKRLAKIGL